MFPNLYGNSITFLIDNNKRTNNVFEIGVFLLFKDIDMDLIVEAINSNQHSVTYCSMYNSFNQPNVSINQSVNSKGNFSGYFL
jgi:hypothetical protein